METLEKELITDSTLANIARWNDKMHMKLLEDELSCMYVKATKILNIKEDFKMPIRAFKDMYLEFEYLHFVFIDITSLQNNPILQVDFGHNLYYLIINTNRFHLRNLDFTIYKTYLVQDGLIRSFDIDADKINLYRTFFNENVGRDIKGSSSNKKITEYITFEKDKVESFRSKLANDGDMTIKLICIDKDCLSTNSTLDVQDHLNNPNNQGKLSLAFQQKNDPSKPNSDFYDIGNMQP